tara:strand:+ start:312 stop:539 length:228 start_codon:yes stop_codon:yes gene_type:complete
MKKIKNKKKQEANQKRQQKRRLKEKQRIKDFRQVKLRRRAERAEEKRAENETAKMQKEIDKITNKEAQTTYKKDA